MIHYRDAVSAARSLIGTPYSELDCINLIKKVIRTAPGGVAKYTTAGTNSLWKSITMSKKYRDLTWRQEGIAGACAGMLAFKRTGSDVHHVGLVTGCGTVIHASSEQGQAVETLLTEREGWSLLAVHRYIEVSAQASEADEQAQSAASAQLPSQNGRSAQGSAYAVTIVDSEGNAFTPAGDFRVLLGSID